VLQDAKNEVEPTDVLTTSFEQAALQGEDNVQELLIKLVESPFNASEEASELEAE
jgi:hypothetical protein